MFLEILKTRYKYHKTTYKYPIISHDVILTFIRCVYVFSRHREYFMESAGARYLPTSCWRIRNRTSERSERKKFLIQKQRVRKYRTSTFHVVLCLLYTYWDIHHFGGLFILNLSKMLKFAATRKGTTKAYVSFCLPLSAVVSPALYRFLYRQWNKRTTPLHFRNVFHFFSAKNSLCKTFLI